MNLILLELKEVVLLIYTHNVTDSSADTATVSSLNEQRKFIVKIYIKAIICTMANGIIKWRGGKHHRLLQLTASSRNVIKSEEIHC
jgi:hypothetical protein